MTPENPSAEREYGRMEQEVAEIRHDLRNHRMVLDSTISDLVNLREDFHKMKTRIATGVAAIVLVSGIIGWAMEMLWKN